MSNLRPTLTIKINGEDREFNMSYGLLNSITEIVTNMDDLANISLNAEVRNSVLSAALAERTKTGKITKAVDVEDVDISVESVGELLDWVLEHIIDFFINRLESAAKLSVRQADRLQSLKPSQTGLKA